MKTTDDRAIRWKIAEAPKAPLTPVTKPVLPDGSPRLCKSNPPQGGIAIIFFSPTLARRMRGGGGGDTRTCEEELVLTQARRMRDAGENSPQADILELNKKKFSENEFFFPAPSQKLAYDLMRLACYSGP